MAIAQDELVDAIGEAIGEAAGSVASLHSREAANAVKAVIDILRHEYQVGLAELCKATAAAYGRPKGDAVLERIDRARGQVQDARIALAQAADLIEMTADAFARDHEQKSIRLYADGFGID